MTEAGTADPAAGFAALMSGAAAAASPGGADTEAPFGWTTDPDGTRRPKKTAGRPRRPPSIDELKADRAAVPAGSEPAAPPQDVAPKPGKRGGRRRSGNAAEPEPGTPQHRQGVITKGINRLYRKAGKIVKVMDADIGTAIIESARNTAGDGEADDSVGAAWDELARTNPRVRRFLLKLVAGGAWGQVLMAHAPILLAIILKESIKKHIPFMKLMQAFLADDDIFDVDAGGQAPPPPPGGLGDLVAGIRPEDLQQMMDTMMQSMGRAAGRAASQPPRAPTVPDPGTVDAVVVD